MRQSGFGTMHCSIARSLDVVGEPWTPLVIRDVHLGVDRFDDIAEDLGISRSLLSTRLRGLVEAGILVRTPYGAHPPRHRYRLTDAGKDLVPVLLALMAWGDRWEGTPDGPPMIVHDRRTGEVVTPTVCDPATGEPITADDVVLMPGPGGRDAPGTSVIARRFAERVRGD